jgi:hypothetical protein
MIVYSIQPKEIYDSIMETGEFITDINKSDNLDFRRSYLWMAEKMNEKIANPRHVEFPIWAWYRWARKEKRPNLNYNLFGYTGNTKEHCLLTLEIPDEDVVLSDYEAWHYVLNNTYFDNSKSESEWKQLVQDFWKLPPEERNQVKDESWNHIFDIDIYTNPSGWSHQGYYVQATFWILKKEYIKDVTFFHGRCGKESGLDRQIKKKIS